MKYKADRRYMGMQLLKAMIGYMIGVVIVLLFLDLSDFWSFIISTGAVAILLYFLYWFPKSIKVENGEVSFVRENSFGRKQVRIPDITGIETSTTPYNTLTIHTRDDRRYHLHPADLQALERALRG